MAANPFGAKPGETYEEYQVRALRELNLKRIEEGLPPIKVDPTTGEGIGFLVHGGGTREFKEKNMPQGSVEDIKNALSQMIGERQAGGVEVSDEELAKDAALYKALEDLVAGNDVGTVIRALISSGVDLRSADPSLFASYGVQPQAIPTTPQANQESLLGRAQRLPPGASLGEYFGGGGKMPRNAEAVLALAELLRGVNQ